MIQLDGATIERLRALGSRKAYLEIRRAVHQTPGGASSEDFLQAYQTLVDQGVLTWEQIERFESD